MEGSTKAAKNTNLTTFRQSRRFEGRSSQNFVKVEDLRERAQEEGSTEAANSTKMTNWRNFAKVEVLRE